MLEVVTGDDETGRRRLSRDSSPSRQLAAREPLTLSIHGTEGPARARLEAFLETAFDRAFSGRIRSHYPQLMSLQDRGGDIHAAVGFRLAGQESLFLEQYLDAPIEVAVQHRFATPVSRDGIAEIGNLASESPGASLVLFHALAHHLDHLGCTHAVATATRQLRRSFARLGFSHHALARADAGRLSEGAADWGGYYARDPEVLVGGIAPALPLLSQMVRAGRGGNSVAPPRLLARRSGVRGQ